MSTSTSMSLPSISLSGIVNLSALETILSTVMTKLEQQSHLIMDLQQQLNQRCTTQQMEHMTKRLDQSFDHMEQRMTQLEARVEEISLSFHRLTDHDHSIQHIHSLLPTYTPLHEYTETKSHLYEIIHQYQHEMKQEKASVHVVNALESSQHQLLDQIHAIQSLLTTKIDRVELPLLHVATDKLNAVIDAEAKLRPRVDKLETDVTTAFRQLAQKENKEAIVSRMQAIHQQFQTKVDITHMEQHVLQPLQTIRQEIAKLQVDEQTIHKIVQQQEESIKQLCTLDTLSSSSSSTLAQHDTAIRLIQSQLQHKVDHTELTTQSQHDRTTWQGWLKQFNQQTTHEWKVQSAFIADLKQQISQLKSGQISLDQKVGIALRFIDWFTDAKLK